MASKKRTPGKGSLPTGKGTSFASASKHLDDLIQDYAGIDGKETKPASSGKTGSKTKPGQSDSQAAGGPREKPDKKPTKPNPDTGASTALSSESEKKEYFDSEENLSRKLDQLAEWIKKSKHFIVFTGAGISTSTGIPDFRSGMNTVLDTGPGAWELRAHGMPRSKEGTKKVKSSLKAIPSKAHMAIVKLLETGHLKFVISQNTDGLHRRSGVHPDNLAELHGNTNKETCTKCGQAYMRDFRTRNAAKVHDHKTGRHCDDPKCRGPLIDSIINFGEGLPMDELNKGFDNGRKADLCVVLGSSLRVTPAADIPAEVIPRGGKLVICNLQKTPLNPICALEIHAKTDDVMSGVMQRLDLQIPPFKLKRCVAMDTTSEREISVMGVDPDRGVPFSFLPKIKIVLPKVKGLAAEFDKEPAVVKLPKPLPSLVQGSGLEVHVSLKFQGHYGEPDITLQYKVLKPGRNLRIIDFDPLKQQWELTDNDYKI